MMMKNKKGSMVLRDIIFMIIIFSGIIALSSIFVTNMSLSYENSNMTEEYNQDSIGKDNLSGTSERWAEIGRKLDGNLFNVVEGTIKAGKELLSQVIKSPATFSSILGNIMEDIGVSEELTNTFVFLLTGLLYILIVFALITAFLKGGKM